jgi:hypothetical protein
LRDACDDYVAGNEDVTLFIRSVYTYNDSALNVVTARDLNASGDRAIQTKTVYDGLRRGIQPS